MPETITDSFTPNQINLLLQGLRALEGALNAIEQPKPEQMDELKEILNNDLELTRLLENSTLSTKQVAKILHCSEKRVHQLAAKNEIQIVENGKKGRSYTTLFMAASIKNYAIRKAHNNLVDK